LWSESTQNLIKMYVLKSSEKFETYEKISIAKAQQKNMNNWSGSCNVSGESLYIDISSLKERVFGGASSGHLLLMTTRIIVGVLL
jgi:hypothetical protein